MTKIVSAFPGTGKTYYCENNSNALDSDSRSFSWKEKGVRNPEFPKNYIEHIKEKLGLYDIIFVSSHKVVRDALVEAGLDFDLVYPLKNNKEEYLKRFKDRGNDDNFINMINENWDKFIDELVDQKCCEHRILMHGKYIMNNTLMGPGNDNYGFDEEV